MRKIFPVFAIVWGAFWIYKANDYGLWIRRGPGGGFFPLIGGVLTVVFSAAYLWQEIKNPTAASIDKKFLYPILAVLGVLVCSYALGLIPCMFLFIFLWLWGYERYTVKYSFSVAAGTMAVLYSVFVFWLSVPLPTGWLGAAIFG